IANIGSIDVAHEAKHELPGLIGADDLPGIARFLRQIEAGDVDLDVEEGRLANAEAVQNEISATRLHGIGDFHLEALGAEHRCTQDGGSKNSRDECQALRRFQHRWPLPSGSSLTSSM